MMSKLRPKELWLSSVTMIKTIINGIMIVKSYARERGILNFSSPSKMPRHPGNKNIGPITLRRLIKQGHH